MPSRQTSPRQSVHAFRKVSSTIPDWLQSLALAILLFIAYSPSLTGGFLWDDDVMLTANPMIRQSDGLLRIWSGRETPDYFPLTLTSYWIEHHLWGLNPMGYRITNLLLHLISAEILRRILSRLRIPMAWFGSALFALHPVNVATVAWISERKNTLAMVFFLLSILLYLRTHETGKKRDYILSIISFVAALLSKTATVMLPVVIILLTIFSRGDVDRRTIKRTLPFWLLSLGFGCLTIWFQYSKSIAEEIVRPEGMLSRIAAAGWCVWFYFWKAIVPIDLSFMYPRWHVDPMNAIHWIPAIGLCAVGIGLRYGIRSVPIRRALMFGCGLYMLNLLPILGFLNIFFMKYSLVADHWQYFAIPALTTMLASGMSFIPASKTQRYLRVTVPAGVLIIFAALTYQRSFVYSDSERIWRDVVDRDPASWAGYTNLGGVMVDRGDRDNANALFRKALEINPVNVQAHTGLADGFMLSNQHRKAKEEYENALADDSKWVFAVNNFAWLLIHSDDPQLRDIPRGIQLAEDLCSITMNANPHYLDTLASGYKAAGRSDDALRTWQLALEAADSRDDKVLIEGIRKALQSIR